MDVLCFDVIREMVKFYFFGGLFEMGEMELSFSEFVLMRIDKLGDCCIVCCGFRVRLLVEFFEGFVMEKLRFTVFGYGESDGEDKRNESWVFCLLM